MGERYLPILLVISGFGMLGATTPLACKLLFYGNIKEISRRQKIRGANRRHRATARNTWRPQSMRLSRHTSGLYLEFYRYWQCRPTVMAYFLCRFV